jgi:hypothetical protein
LLCVGLQLTRQAQGAQFCPSCRGFAKVAIFTTKFQSKNRTLITHKTVKEALNPTFCQTAVIGSVFFLVCRYVHFLLHCLLSVRWGRQALWLVLALA